MTITATKRKIAEASVTNPRQEATLTLRCLTIGVVNRRHVEKMFLTLQKSGAEIHYRADKGLLSTEYYDLRITAKVSMLKSVLDYLDELDA